ncbi:MAG: nucleotidyltransferase domain-containing protein [Alphaproteobacteria bacterium]|nr:nucleotidyltransferase domain-containing protein [Alphaproteobacteria bacterium]
MITRHGLSLEPRHLKITQDILAKYPYTFYAFGSRARGNPKRFSDLDLCFLEDIPYNIRSHIEEDFEESDLPYKVDCVHFFSCDETFREIIQKDLVLLSPVGVDIRDCESIPMQVNFTIKDTSL